MRVVSSGGGSRVVKQQVTCKSPHRRSITVIGNRSTKNVDLLALVKISKTVRASMRDLDGRGNPELYEQMVYW
jgi:hypothetical protein